MTDRREAMTEDLRALAGDLQSLLDSATTDPKERRRKELRWRVLYGALAALTALAARRAATKAWAILTGEQPPAKGAPQPRSTTAPPTEGESERSPTAEAAATESRSSRA
jgi:hypothetical protein